MDILNEVKKVFDIETHELMRVEEDLGESIVEVVQMINECTGKVVLCGMGKPGHIARKISATMSSLGISSYVLHPGEAMHGDLGTLDKNDIIIIISNSGETSEICRIIPNIRYIGTKIVAITSHADSTLALYADHIILLPVMHEAHDLNLAPTSSTTAALVVGDAIAVVVSKLRGFRKNDFALFHPAGALGRKLTTKVKDIMAYGDELPYVKEGSNMEITILNMCKTGLGAVIVVDDDMNMKGLVTDGDLKRYLMLHWDIYEKRVDDVMTVQPVYVYEDLLAVKALKIMEDREKQLSVLPVLDKNDKVVGLVRNHDIIKLGIFV